MRHLLIAAAAALLLSACDAPSTDLESEARRIARDAIIVDTHIDVPYRLRKKPVDVTRATKDGEFDYPRAVAGGLNAPFMSIYTPAKLEAEGKSYAEANALIDIVEDIVARAPDKFAIARNPADVRAHFAAGRISLPLGMENGSPIDGDLANLRHFHARGVRYVTLAHGKSNILSDSSYDDNKRWGGLSPFGIEVIGEMNRLGIMVDVSHLSDAAFYQVLDVSRVPVIASHSSARHFTPGNERNMSDGMIRALAAHDGVIMIAFGSMFITAEAQAYFAARREAEKEFKAANPDVTEAFLDDEFPKIYAAEHGPLPYADLSDVLDHFDHVIQLVGVDHVGIGSDYDGVGDSLPTGLKDVASYPNLVRGLLERGYDEDAIRKILGENLLRVWQAVEDAARNQATTSSNT